MSQEILTGHNLPSKVSKTLLHSEVLSEVKNKKKLDLNKYLSLTAKLPEKFFRLDKALPNPPLPESLRANKDVFEYLEELEYESYLYRSGELFEFISCTKTLQDNGFNTISGRLLGLYRYTIKTKNKISSEYLVNLGLGSGNKAEYVFYLADFCQVQHQSAALIDLITLPKPVNELAYGDETGKRLYKTGEEICFLEPVSGIPVQGRVTSLYKSPFEDEDEICITYLLNDLNHDAAYLVKYFFEEVPELLEKDVVLRSELKPGIKLFLETDEKRFSEIVIDSFYRKGPGTFMVRYYTESNGHKVFNLMDFSGFREKARKKEETVTIQDTVYTNQERLTIKINGSKTPVTFLGLFTPFFSENLSSGSIAFQNNAGKVFSMAPEAFHKNVRETEASGQYEQALSKVPDNLLFVDFVKYTASKDSFEQKKFNFNSNFLKSRIVSFQSPFGRISVSQVREKGQDNALLFTGRAVNITLADTNSDSLTGPSLAIFSEMLGSVSEKVFKTNSGTLTVLDEISLAVNSAHKEISKFMQKNCGDNSKVIYTNLFYKGGDRVYYHQAGNVFLLNISSSGLKDKSKPEENDNGALNGIFPPEKVNSGQPGLFEMPVTVDDKILIFSDDFMNNLRSGIFRGLPLNVFCKKVASLNGEQIIETVLLIHKLNNLVMERNRKDEFKYPVSFAGEALKVVTMFLSEFSRLDYPEPDLNEKESMQKKFKSFSDFCEMYYHYRTNKEYKDTAGEIIAASPLMSELKEILGRKLELIGRKLLEKMAEIDSRIAENYEQIQKDSVFTAKSREEIQYETDALLVSKNTLLEKHKDLFNRASLLAVETLRQFQSLSASETLAAFHELLKYQLESGNIKYTARRYDKLVEQLKDGGLHISTAYIDDPETKAEQKLQLSTLEIEFYNKVLTKKDDLTVIALEIERTDVSNFEIYDVREKENIISKYISGELKPKKRVKPVITKKNNITDTELTNTEKPEENGFYDYRKTYF